MFETVRAAAAEILKRREVDRIVYFHCDHFEPWIYHRALGQSICEANRRHVELFAEFTGRIDYARRLTLFYKPLVAAVPAGQPDLDQVPGDGVGFRRLSAAEQALATDTMRDLLRNSRHEVQVHVHHEAYIGNRKYSLEKDLAAFMRTANTPELDRARWDLALRLHLDRIVADAGIDRARWFFVHGLWALNASDQDVCTITDEIARLQSLGCAGDFTFPAGRRHCSPATQTEPFFVRPVDAAKGYDLPEAEPEPAFGNRDAAARGRFFIWATRLASGAASLDYFSGEFHKREAALADWVTEILQDSVVQGGTLYWKTHAHSMAPDYVLRAALPVFPHQHPVVQDLFAIILNAANDIGAAIDFLTAAEVHDEYVAGGRDRPEIPAPAAAPEPAPMMGSAIAAPPEPAPIAVLPDLAAPIADAVLLVPDAPLVSPAPPPIAALAWSPPAASASADTLELLRPFAHRAGFRFSAALPAAVEMLRADSELLATASRLVLCEDGVPLRASHAAEAEITADGRGAYVHRYGEMQFASSDNSDPNGNGRSYTIALGAARPKLIAFGGDALHAMNRSLARRGVTTAVDHGVATANAAEARQLLRIFRRQLTPPPALMPFILNQAEAPVIGPDILAEIAGTLLEISPGATIRRGDLTLSRQLVALHVVAPLQREGGRVATLATEWYRAILAGDEDQRPALAAELLALLPGADVQRRDIIAAAVGVAPDEAALRADIQALRAEIGAPLVVLAGDDGMLAGICAALDVPLLSPPPPVGDMAEFIDLTAERLHEAWLRLPAR